MMPFSKMTEHDFMSWMRGIILYEIRQGLSREFIHCVIEKVHSMPAQGVSSSFAFGENYGWIRGIIQSMFLSYTLITPQSWMKTYGMKKTKEESKTEWKNRLKQLAQSKYPNEKITANTADTLLIAHFCKISNL